MGSEAPGPFLQRLSKLEQLAGCGEEVACETGGQADGPADAAIEVGSIFLVQSVWVILR